MLRPRITGELRSLKPTNGRRDEPLRSMNGSRAPRAVGPTATKLSSLERERERERKKIAGRVIILPGYSLVRAASRIYSGTSRDISLLGYSANFLRNRGKKLKQKKKKKKKIIKVGLCGDFRLSDFSASLLRANPFLSAGIVGNCRAVTVITGQRTLPRSPLSPRFWDHFYSATIRRQTSKLFSWFTKGERAARGRLPSRVSRNCSYPKPHLCTREIETTLRGPSRPSSIYWTNCSAPRHRVFTAIPLTLADSRRLLGAS